MTEPSRGRVLLGALALAASGPLQAVAGPPTSLHLLHPLFLAVPLLVLSRTEGPRAWLGGWLYGATAAIGIFWWLGPTVVRFSNLGVAGAGLVLLLFGAVFGFWGAALGWGAAAARRASGRLWPLGVAALFTACEFLNPHLFPYTQGMSWFKEPDLFLLAALTGPHGVTLLLAAVGGWLAAAAEGALGWTPRSEATATLRASGAVLAAMLVGAVAWTQTRQARIDEAVAGAETRRFAIIQPNVDVPGLRAMRKEGGRLASERDLVALTESALADVDGVDIVMWAEGAVRGSPRGKSRAYLGELAREHDVAIWTGVLDRRGPRGQRTRHNGAFRIAPDGTLSEPADKNILVPFGEYMPLADALPFLARVRNYKPLVPGAAPAVIDGPEAPPAAFPVCYEATRFRYVRQLVDAGAQILATVTYDGWFGDTSGLDLHMMVAASMSAATGTPMVRAAATGISMATGPDGQIIGRTRRAERTWLVLDVPMVAVPAPYVRWGDSAAWGCVLVGFGLAVRRRRRDVAVPLVFLGLATVTWGIDVRVPPIDVAVWTGAVWLVLMARRPGAGPGGEQTVH